MPIFHKFEQGTSEWLSARAGLPTSSCFDQIITPKGKPSASAEKYLYKLLAERLMGHPIVEHVSMWQQRGTALEQGAVSFYELQRDTDTEPIGFATNDEGTIGSSPDRLVGIDGLLEIKCSSEWVQMSFLMESGSAYETYKIQCQGQLWVTGRKWVDILAFHPELPPALHRIEPDPDFIELLSAAVTTFSLELERQWALCCERGWNTGQREPREKSLVDILKEELVNLKTVKVSE